MISVLYSGYCAAGGSYADYQKGITIDLIEGKVLALGEFFSQLELQSIIDNLIETQQCKIIGYEDGNREQKKSIIALLILEGAVALN